MHSYTVILIIILYFGVLLLISHLISRKGSDNDAFFRANRQSPWWVVAIGMIGTSISGVTFVSVPGMVREINFSYMQTVLGFFFGYVVIARVLLPLYYKLHLTTIYTYLDERFGRQAYKTGASFFLLGKTIGAAARLYVVALILQTILFDAWGVPFWLTVCCTVFLIWLYTNRSGIKTVIWTDTIQTIILIAALVLLVVEVAQNINLTHIELFKYLSISPKTDVFVFDDWHSKQFFWKQFLSGVFIPIVMTGLDQDMMQKNLTCKTLKDAQKNMYWYGIAFVPINFLFLTLGAMLLMLATQNGITLPASSDNILTLFATQYLGNTVFVLFVVGIIAAAFSSADSALAALTTSFSVDILEVDKLGDNDKAVKIRKKIHIIIAIVFVVIILLFREINDKSVIDAIYTIVSYTYGPLLGLYAFGLFTRCKTNNKLIPYTAVISPVLCYFLNFISTKYWNYSFSYELLMLNGLITFAGLWLFRQKK
ncbi:MAG TPA: sodium:solute symporter [Paludibacteraceae bacterium]|nr:sodium:solute symporter [Paludibacteraceae bacterium]